MGVGVGAGVRVGLGVRVGVGVRVAVAVAVGIGVIVGVAVGGTGSAAGRAVTITAANSSAAMSAKSAR